MVAAIARTSLVFADPMRLRFESSPLTEESASAIAPTQGPAVTNS